MSFKTLTTTLAAAVADDGTVTLAYPAGTDQDYFTGANASADGVVVFDNNIVEDEGASTFSLTYGSSDITLTNLSGASWAAGTELIVQLGRAGNDRPGFQPSDAITSLTDNSGGTADDTVEACGTAVAGVDGTGSNAASKADVDTRLTAIANNFADIAAKQEEILRALRSETVISG